MSTIKVQTNQSMADIIIMACGSMEGGMAFCALNDVAISDIPIVGATMLVPGYDGSSDGLITDNSDMPDALVLQYLAQNNIVIGTAVIPIKVYGGEDGTAVDVSEDGSAMYIPE